MMDGQGLTISGCFEGRGRHYLAERPLRLRIPAPSGQRRHPLRARGPRLDHRLHRNQRFPTPDRSVIFTHGVPCRTERVGRPARHPCARLGRAVRRRRQPVARPHHVRLRRHRNRRLLGTSRRAVRRAARHRREGRRPARIARRRDPHRQQDYLASTLVLSPYDEKILQSFTYYGLPMYSIKSPIEDPIEDHQRLAVAGSVAGLTRRLR